MDAHTASRPPMKRQPPGRDHAWVGAFVAAVDDRLRIRHGVHEFTDSPDCIFRMQLVFSDTDFVLSDSTRVRLGDRIINLHLWNEQIPPVPECGPTLAWACRMNRALDVSLRELAQYIATRPDLEDIVVIRANMSFGLPRQCRQLVRISARYGFEHVPVDATLSLSERLHRLGENILISMMILARNAASLRADSLLRDRTLVYLSRRKIEQRYRPDTSRINPHELALTGKPNRAPLHIADLEKHVIPPTLHA